MAELLRYLQFLLVYAGPAGDFPLVILYGSTGAETYHWSWSVSDIETNKNNGSRRFTEKQKWHSKKSGSLCTEGFLVYNAPFPE